jgi:hypothetical protein
MGIKPRESATFAVFCDSACCVREISIGAAEASAPHSRITENSTAFAGSAEIFSQHFAKGVSSRVKFPFQIFLAKAPSVCYIAVPHRQANENTPRSSQIID